VNKKIVIMTVMMLTLLLVSQVSADKIGIDNFNDDQKVCSPVAECPVGILDKSSVSYASAFGGTRDMKVTRESGLNAVSAKTGDNGVGVGDLSSYSGGFSTTGTWEIVWDGDTNPDSISHTLDEDLTDGLLNTGIYLGGVSTDYSYTFTVTVFSDATHWSYSTYTVPLLTSNSLVSLPFGGFTSGGIDGPVDFEHVSAVHFFANAPANLDASIDYITVDDDTPTAVSLQNIYVNSTSTVPVIGFIAFALMAIVGTSVAITRRQRA
jgi:hypothetical protein